MTEDLERGLVSVECGLGLKEVALHFCKYLKRGTV